MYGVLQGDLFRPQQPGKGLCERQHQHRNSHADHHQGHQILRKQLVGTLGIFLAQEIGDDGGGAHGEDDRDGE